LGIKLVGQALCHLSHVSSPLFTLVIFLDKVLHFCHGQALDSNLPTYAFPIGGILAMNHHTQLVSEMWSF
jgi:hypothetical protein